ncbi:interferon alpha/beta receptor 1a-like isoform X1 [Arapaima gigas]
MNGPRGGAVLPRVPDTALRLWFCLAGLLLCSGVSELPVPHNVTMEATNNFYVLKWIWDQWETKDTVRFTVDHSYYDQENYVTACNRTAAWQCNLTSENLSYFACYMLRVRAEGPGKSSNWHSLLFCPHINASLGPPSDVKLESSNSGLRVTIEEPLMANNKQMSFICLPSYHILYWEMDAPQQTYDMKGKQTIVYLHPLKAETEYCLQIRTMCQGLENDNPFTTPKCGKTSGKGLPPLWHILLPVFVFLLLVILLATIYWKKIRSLFPVYIQPTSILGFPMTFTPPLQLPEENCTTLQEVLYSQPEVEPSSSGISQWQGSFLKDSGISFWESKSSSGQDTRDKS